MKRFFYILMSTVFLTVGFAESQEQTGGSSMAIGFNAGIQKPFCDVLHTGLGPAGEFMVKLLVSDFFNLSFAAGYGQLNDGFTNNTFVTNLITADLKANLNLISAGKINPYVFLGLGVFNFQYNKTSALANSDPTYDKRYYDGSFIFGGGMEIVLNPKFAINAFADYRHTTGDAIDGINRKAKDGYLNARLGVTYYLGGGKVTRPEEELLALDSLDFGKADTSGEEYDIFEDKLGRLEAAEADNTMEQYIRIKSRVDELNRLISEKEVEIDDLRNSLDSQDQRIADLENQLVSTTTSYYGFGGDDFSVIYDEGLRGFYSRDYNSAIQIFKRLRDNYPSHKLVSNCQYWIGESLFGMRAYTDAREAFSRVFDYSFSYKKDDATLMLGRCYSVLGDKVTARTYFQNVLDQYPDSEYVEKAREWLARI